MNLKTKDVEVSAAELESWLGVSVQTVSEYARRGIIPRAATRCIYLLRASVQGYITHMKSAAAGRENPTAMERTRLLKAQADGVEKKVKALNEKLVSASDVASTWADAKRRVRGKLLELPERIDKRLPGRLTLHDIDAIRKEALLALSPFDADGKPIPAPDNT